MDRLLDQNLRTLPEDAFECPSCEAEIVAEPYTTTGRHGQYSVTCPECNDTWTLDEPEPDPDEAWDSRFDY